MFYIRYYPKCCPDNLNGNSKKLLRFAEYRQKFDLSKYKGKTLPGDEILIRRLTILLGNTSDVEEDNYNLF